MIPKYILRKNKKKSVLVKGKRGSADCPRMTVFRSNKYIYAQLIDDVKGKTLVSAGSRRINKADLKSSKPVDIARSVGKLIGEKALKIKLKTAFFDRRRFKYHGQVKALAEGAREVGLKI